MSVGQGGQPLSGVLVVDLSRMLPGAVLGRVLLDLGARLIKVEEPGTGDPLRSALPLVDGIGAGFQALLGGCESLAVDLATPEGAGAIRRIARHADVLVESFRPGTLERWELGFQRLQGVNPGLVVCSLTGFASGGELASHPAHDLNFMALSGLLSQLGGGGAVPRVQIADVTGGLLAGTGILAALLRRGRNGLGCHIEQPLASAPLPFLAWGWAEEVAGGGGTSTRLLSGSCPAYRTYRCGDGKSLAIGALEPKFWVSFVAVLGLQNLAGVGLDDGPEGAAATVAVEQALAGRPRAEWLALLAQRDVPATAVNDLQEAISWGYFRGSGAGAGVAGSRSQSSTLAGPFLPSFGQRSSQVAPRLGEHTDAILREFGVAS